jgi:hypothetical protein
MNFLVTGGKKAKQQQLKKDVAKLHEVAALL